MTARKKNVEAAAPQPQQVAIDTSYRQPGRLQKKIIAAHYPEDTVKEIKKLVQGINLYLEKNDHPQITLQDFILASINLTRKELGLIPLITPEGYNTEFLKRLENSKSQFVPSVS